MTTSATITPSRGSVSGNTNITFTVSPLVIVTGKQLQHETQHTPQQRANTAPQLHTTYANILIGYTCVFTGVGWHSSTPAKVTSPNTVHCPTAPFPQIGGGDVTVSLLLNGAPYTNDSLPFTYYGTLVCCSVLFDANCLLLDCASSQTCETCFSSAYSECQWCYATALCGGIGSCATTSSSNTPTCPSKYYVIKESISKPYQHSVRFGA